MASAGISAVTRRDISELIGGSWHGRLKPTEFLERLYSLDTLPSDDPREKTFREDIARHSEAFSDWKPDWIFTDKRLQLDNDERLLRLLAESMHPEVRDERDHDENRLASINDLLVADGFELFVAGSMSGRSVFSHRRVGPRRPPSGDFPTSLVAGMSQIITGLTTSTGIDSMFESEDFPRPADLALNKEEKVKAWLRTAQATTGFNHWNGLGRVLKPLMEPAEERTQRADEQKRIREVLAKRHITYLPGGLFTTAPVTAVYGLPDLSVRFEPTWTLIGSGGFGSVYRVPDQRLGIDFAYKVFDPFPGVTSQAEALARFDREAGLLYRLRHEGIVRIFDVGQLVDGRPFIKMEYFDGLNLQKAREHQSPSSLATLAIIGRLTAAVEHAHSRSILHRDIKPSNVLVSASLEEVRLIDFGVGILVEEAVERARLTKTAQKFGDTYAAPELLENAKTTDSSIDIYSIGAVWFWLHSGRSPRGTGLDGMIDDFDIGPSLKALLRSCLMPAAKRPTASTLLEQLRQLFKKSRRA